MTSLPLNTRIDALEKELSALSQDVGCDEEARKRLLALTQRTMGMVEAPHETIWRFIFQHHINACIKTAIDIGLFDVLNKNEKPMTAAELADATGADEILIVRLLRPLATIHIVHETGFQTYVTGAVPKALSTPALRGGFKNMYEGAAHCLAKMPDFLAETGYKNPEGPIGVFQYTMQTDVQFFPWLCQRPTRLQDFSNMLDGWKTGRIDWFDYFPVKERILDGAKSDPKGTPLLVDVAGNVGADLQNFKNRFPEANGTLVLEDLPDVIDSVKELDSDISRVKYDFFTPQQVKGARAYFFHYICHDWSDARCRDILGNTVAAMTPGYSKILINDLVIPDTGSALLPALLDINMIALLSGMERTESQWRELLGSVGLEIVKIWSSGNPEAESLIEAVRSS